MKQALVSQFKTALANIKGPRHYDLIKSRAELLTQAEQLEIVDLMIAARFRIEGGVA